LTISLCADEKLITTLDAVITRIIAVIIRKTLIRIDIFLPLGYIIHGFMKNCKHFQALKTGPDDAGRRLDRVLRKALPDLSLSLIHRLLRQGKARLDGKPAAPNDRVPSGAVIQIAIPEEPRDNSAPARPSFPREMQFGTLPDILWRGSGIIVFNKPPGLATHGDDSLDALVKAWLGGKLPLSLSFKPGPLHRLDKPTSGAVAFSETIEGARLFSRLLREHKAVKTYLAIVEGRVTGEAVWRDELVRDSNAGKTFAAGRAGSAGSKFTAGKNALTAVKALACNDSHTLIEARIVTGRTHQIRAQAAAHGHPLAGDRKYGGRGSGGFFLHAWKMDLGGHVAGFPRPLTAPLPDSFQSRVTALFGAHLIPLTEARRARRTRGN
jgi:23S rRNA pseudouridine955/2504/2580 synthase